MTAEAPCRVSKRACPGVRSLDVVILGDLLDSCQSSVDVPGNGALQPSLLVLQLSLQVISLPVAASNVSLTMYARDPEGLPSALLLFVQLLA